MKNLFVFSISLFLIQGVASAQIIERDNTEVLDDISGEPLFTLNAGEDVYSFKPDGNWYKVRKEVVVDPDDLIDEQYLPEGTLLKNEKGKEIGKVLREVKIEEGRSQSGFRSSDVFHAVLEGYLFKTKFQKNSMPEQRLSEILAIKNRTQQQEAFRELREMYDFEEREFEDLTVYAYREENKTVAEEKDFRLIVIFRGETTPYAVITNEHEVTAEKIKDETESGSFTTIYFYKPSPSQRGLIENEILYTYLAL